MFGILCLSWHTSATVARAVLLNDTTQKTSTTVARAAKSISESMLRADFGHGILTSHTEKTKQQQQQQQQALRLAAHRKDIQAEGS